MVLRQIVVSVGALFVAVAVQGSSAEALSMKECSAKYKAAKDAGTLGDMRWNDFMRSGSNGRANALGGAIASDCTAAENDSGQALSRAGGGRDGQRSIP
jgi:hypothetical protein